MAQYPGTVELPSSMWAHRPPRSRISTSSEFQTSGSVPSKASAPSTSPQKHNPTFSGLSRRLSIRKLRPSASSPRGAGNGGGEGVDAGVVLRQDSSETDYGNFDKNALRVGDISAVPEEVPAQVDSAYSKYVYPWRSWLDLYSECSHCNRVLLGCSSEGVFLRGVSNVPENNRCAPVVVADLPAGGVVRTQRLRCVLGLIV